MKCRLFHDWKWIDEIPGRTSGCAMTGTCQRCGKVKHIPYVNWGDPRHNHATLRHPIKAFNQPPSPPRAKAEDQQQ